MDIKNIINNIYSLPEDSIQSLLTNVTKMIYPKGSHLIEAGVVESDIFFVAQGIVRAYIPMEGRNITFWIGTEGATVVSLKSYVNNEPGYETVECMENTIIYILKRSVLESLFLQDINIANWGRKFAEMEFLQTEERFIPLLFTTAAERYEELLKKQPHLFLRIPLECLASYLGITPVSLSRIRAKVSNKQV
jgi:CRP-like cAMP-binding protein|uniref:Crp/Fnr regulator n=1 Tax=Prevotella bivia TaxID=28125 RepID=A0A2Z4XFW1_9BACT|nr:Crp/Fnr regulator [Prevotella bivia]